MSYRLRGPWCKKYQIFEEEKTNEIKEIYCSFCGKEKAQTKKLIAGPKDIFICDECVALCVEMLIKTPVEHEEAKYNRNIDEIE